MQLDRGRVVLGASVPDQVVETLAGRAWWWRWWQRRERQLGARRWGGYDHTGRTYMAATSATTSASLVQLTRSLKDDVLGPALAERWRTKGREAEGKVPELYRAVGGPIGRDGYLRMVTGSGWE